MKTIRTAAFAVLAISLSLLASCALLGPNEGEISFSIPDHILASSAVESSRAVLSQDGTLGYVRVYMESAGAILFLGTGGVVFETAIPADKTITINDVPPMRNCTIYLALSEKGSGDFRAVKYAKSGLFHIVAGVTSEVVVDTYQSPFRDIAKTASGFLTDTGSGVRALEFGGSLYFLAGGTLYKQNVETGVADEVLAVSGSQGDVTIGKGLGLAKGKELLATGGFGADQLWINTDQGIWALSADGRSISQVGAAGKAVLDSGALTLAYQDEETAVALDVAYYQYAGGVGGAISSDSAWEWEDMADYIDEVDLGPIKDTIQNSTTKLIADYDFVSGEAGVTFGYAIVPGIASLRIGADIKTTLEDLNTEGASAVDILNTITAGNSIMISPDDLIRAVSYLPGEANSTLFVGTSRGLYSIATNAADGKLPENYVSTAINLGRATDIIRVEAKTIGADAYVAALNKSGSVFIVKNGVLVEEFKYYTGIPQFDGKAATTGDLFWSAQGLVITGVNGAVLYTIPTSK